jgi:hypothetical protein
MTPISSALAALSRAVSALDSLSTPAQCKAALRALDEARTAVRVAVLAAALERTAGNLAQAAESWCGLSYRQALRILHSSQLLQRVRPLNRK